MQAYHLLRTGDVSSLEDCLAVREHDIPAPGPGEVLLRVRAVSLNYRDLLILQGRYPVLAKANVIPLSDGAGEVIKVGEGVTRCAPGDKMAATYFTRWFDGRLTLPLAMRQHGASMAPATTACWRNTACSPRTRWSSCRRT